MRNHLFQALFCLAFFTVTELASAVARPLRPVPLNKALLARIKKRGRGFVSDSVGRYITRAVEMAEDKEYGPSIELLEWHYNRGSLSPLEKAKLGLYIARFHRQNKAYKKSRLWLKKSINLESLGPPDHLQALFALSQTYAQEENYDKAMTYLKLWFSLNENPAPQAYILLARCHYGKNRILQALKYAEHGLSLIDSPKESWLMFVSGLHIRQKRYKKALPHLESLVALYPARASHWRQLAGVYLRLEQNGPALVTLDLMRKMGHLKDKAGVLNLASLYMQRGQPHQGAKLLSHLMERGIVPPERAYWELTAEGWLLARERETALMYLKRAAKTAQRTGFFIRYGQILLEQESWSVAQSAFEKALGTKEMLETAKSLLAQKKTKALQRQKQSQWLDSLQGSASLKLVLYDTQSNPPKGQLEKQEPEKEQPLVASLNKLKNIQLGMGTALYGQKQYRSALSWFKKAVELDEGFLPAWEWMDQTEKKILEEEAAPDSH